jgi:hypothetical protein
MIYPISYSIPSECFCKTKTKTKKIIDIAKLVPGKLDTYIYNDQETYYKMYQEGKFGITHKKYGWDCLRHYEILANNCIPLFKNLENCPKNTMINIPKNDIIYINKKFMNKNLSEDEYAKQLNKIFNYSINNLTCKKNAEYFINKILDLNSDLKNKKNIKILMLSGMIGYRNVNYTRELLSIGLRKILNENFIEYPKINVIYKNCKNIKKYIGKGFTYGKILDDININRDNIENRIKNKEFDIIIYGKTGKKRGEIDDLINLKYWNTVHKNYDKNKIIFIYGGDLLRDKNDKDLVYHQNYGICFVRELK